MKSDSSNDNTIRHSVFVETVKFAKRKAGMPQCRPLLTALDAAGHVHLVIGSNPLASARCARSIEVGAKVKVVAPEDAEVHYALMKRIDEGTVEWLKRGFRDEDLETLGRDEVEGVVDAVFITLGGKNALSMQGIS